MFWDNCIKNPKGHVKMHIPSSYLGRTKVEYLGAGYTSEFFTGYGGILMYTKFWRQQSGESPSLKVETLLQAVKKKASMR